MTSGDISSLLIVDTDVVSAIGWNKGRSDDFRSLVDGRTLLVSFATVGELWYGAEKRNWGPKQRSRINAVLANYTIIPATRRVAEAWGRIHARFRDQMQVNDMWTAACALAQSDPPPILTANLRHFEPMAAEFDLEILHPDR